MSFLEKGRIVPAFHPSTSIPSQQRMNFLFHLVKTISLSSESQLGFRPRNLPPTRDMAGEGNRQAAFPAHLNADKGVLFHTGTEKPSGQMLRCPVPLGEGKGTPAIQDGGSVRSFHGPLLQQAMDGHALSNQPFCRTQAELAAPGNIGAALTLLSGSRPAPHSGRTAARGIELPQAAQDTARGFPHSGQNLPSLTVFPQEGQVTPEGAGAALATSAPPPPDG